MPKFSHWIITCTLIAQPLFATPTNYVLQPDISDVRFDVPFGPDLITGSFPISRADLTLDFDNVAASTVVVDLDVVGAKASFPFAANAMRGPKVLDAQTYPTIHFVSQKVARDGKDAIITGDITLRGVTKPAILRATIWRQAGHEAGDLTALTIRLTGQLNRLDFGAAGWADMVGDTVNLDIMARIKRVD